MFIINLVVYRNGGLLWEQFVYTDVCSCETEVLTGVLCLCEHVRVRSHVLCMCNRDTCHDVCSFLSVDGSKVVVSVK